jgi:hypothetical protein
MNNHETNKMSMFGAVNAVLNENKQTVDAMPPLAEAAAKFRQATDEIIQRNSEYLGVAEGAVAAKNGALDDLVQRVFRLGNAVYALGRKTGNEQYKSAGNMSLSDIEYMREPGVEQYCSKIAGLVKECAAELAIFGIAAEEVVAFDKALDIFRQQVAAKEVKIAESKAARKSLYECFDKADEILIEDIDTLVELAKIGNPDFYRQYKAARAIRDVGGRIPKNGKTETVAKPEAIPLAAAAVT